MNSGFRRNVDFLIGNYILLRSSNRLHLELADCFCLDLPKEDVKMEAAGGVPTTAFVILMNQGKMNQYSRVEYGSCLRHYDPEAFNANLQRRDGPTMSSGPTNRPQAGADAAGELCQSNSDRFRQLQRGHPSTCLLI